MVGAVFLFGRGLWSEERSRQSAIRPRRVTTVEAGPAISRPDASRESVARQSAILGIAGKNAESRIATGRFSRSVIIAVSENSLSVLLLVGSELSEQKFALEILKQRLTSFRIKLDDDCCPRFLRG